ncbi:unnamed protein product, partial [Polarella glacialis]
VQADENSCIQPDENTCSPQKPDENCCAKMAPGYPMSPCRGGSQRPRQPPLSPVKLN